MTAEFNESVQTPGEPQQAPVASPEAPAVSFWDRIKNHKVVQWTLAYVAIVYALLQGSEMLAGALEWPHAWIRILTLVLILGVPLVAVLAWYHGAHGRQRISATEVMIIAILLALGGAFLWRDSKTEHSAASAANAAGQAAKSDAGKSATTAPAPPAASIAVLAFSDLSAEGNQAYFSDGIAEEILNVLAHVDGLKVASRTSSFQFRKSELGVPAIAQKLGVRHILEGSVRRAGNTVRISTQLIDAPTDQHLWSQTFDRPLTTANLFAIQDEIAKSVVDRLTAIIGTVGNVARPEAVKADTADVNAYDLYLRGRSLFIARSVENLSESAHVLKAALAKDPKFARAWEMLGAVFVISGFWGVKEETDYQSAALAAADTALSLDPSLSMAYAVRGQAQVNSMDRNPRANWDELMANFSEAVTHDSRNATAFLWRGGSYVTLGFPERAAEDFTRCLDVDPAYETCRRFLAIARLFSGRTDEAMRLYAMGLERNYTNVDALFASAALARHEPLGALGILVQQFREQPQLIQPLYRALTDPAFSERDRQDALALIEYGKGGADVATFALWLLKDYDRVRTAKTDSPYVMWAQDDAAWLTSSGRKQMILLWRLPEYWRKHGFPPRCRPIGSSDFACR